jgi:hypothetical protein
MGAGKGPHNLSQKGKQMFQIPQAVIARNVYDMNQQWNNAVRIAHEGTMQDVMNFAKWVHRKLETTPFRRNFYAEMLDMLRIIFTIRFLMA